MKKILVFLCAISLLTFSVARAAEVDISSIDKQQISEKMNILVQSINDGSVQKIIALIAPAKAEIQKEIQNRVQGKIAYRLNFSGYKNNPEIVSPTLVKIKAKFAASGIGWNVSGVSTYFVFEKQNNAWYITDTDFYQKLGMDYVMHILKVIFSIVGPIILISFIFWLWMFIDCIRRKFDSKTLWIILLLLFSVIAAIFYLFMIKLKKVGKIGS